jgi:hypothetical protein
MVNHPWWPCNRIPFTEKTNRNSKNFQIQNSSELAIHHQPEKRSGGIIA